MCASPLEDFHAYISKGGSLFPNQTRFSSYQLLHEHFREFFKNSEFLAQQLVQDAISRAANANTSSYEASGYSPALPDRHFQACSHMWHMLQNSTYWEDFLEPTF